MKVKREGEGTSRRGFLKSVAAAGSAAAVSAVVTQTAGAAAPTASVAKRDEGTTGYHVTPHILDYYEKARF